MIFENKNNKTVRANVANFSDNYYTGGQIVSSIKNYLDGYTTSAIAQKMATRYCSRITKSDDGSVFQADPVEAMRSAVDAGLFEIIPTGIFKKIISNVAVLASISEYDYLDDAGKEQDDFKTDMLQARTDGNFNNKFKYLDAISVACGSAVMLIQVLDNKLDYIPIATNKVYLVYADYVSSGDIKRASNTLNIDDATAIIIETGTVKTSGNSIQKSFVAFFGRSDKYEQGRMVSYVSSEWKDVPAIGSEIALDHYDSAGNIGNPLTILQDNTGDYSTPEYPITVWYSGLNNTDSILPTNEELYDTSLEIDLANSRVLLASLKSATGMVVFSRELGSSPIVPENLGEGVNILGQGQSLNVLSVPAGNSDIVNKIINDNMARLAESIGLPSYKLAMSKLATVPSGVALAELDRPEQDMRDNRHDSNTHSMERLFEIEKCLIRIENKDPEFAKDIKQKWSISAIKHKTELEEINEATQLNALQVVDKKEIAKKVFANIETDQEATDYIDKLEPAPVSTTPALGRFGV